jgi:hypothetical protein
MRPEEIAALGDLASEAAAGATRQIQELHSGIAGRVWRRVGPAAIPVKLAHDRIARSAYAAAGELTRTVVRAGAQAASAARAPDSPSIERTPAGRAVVSALNGAFGDTLERNGNPLALTMSFRRRGRDLEITRESLAAAYPNAKPRLAVFVHGLCETDDAWNGIPARPAAHRVPYGHRMEIELGYSPLYLRYNTGRHISENGRELAGLLEDLVAAWPIEVHEVVLIGHSMGGLVSRSACHYGVDSKCVAKVRHVFTLGTPHRGAPLEQVTNAATAALARLPTWSTSAGPTRTATPTCRTPRARSRSYRAPATTSSAPRCRARPMPPSAESSATCSCSSRALGPIRDAATVCSSRSSTTTTSARPTTSTC